MSYTVKQKASRIADLIVVVPVVLIFVILLITIPTFFRMATHDIRYVSIHGNSMYPTFNDGDRVLAKKVDISECETGDIVVYASSNGINIIHRIIAFDTTSDNKKFAITQGDNNNCADSEWIYEGTSVYSLNAISEEDEQALRYFKDINWFKIALTIILVCMALMTVIVVFGEPSYTYSAKESVSNTDSNSNIEEIVDNLEEEYDNEDDLEQMDDEDDLD